MGIPTRQGVVRRVMKPRAVFLCLCALRPVVGSRAVRPLAVRHPAQSVGPVRTAKNTDPPPRRTRPPRRPKGSGADGWGRRCGAAFGEADRGRRVAQSRRRRVGGRVGQTQARGAAHINAQRLVRGVRSVAQGG